MELGVPSSVIYLMYYGLREFKVMLVGAENAPDRPVSVLAHTPTIALYRGAVIAMDCDARDFEIVPGKRSNYEQEKR